MTVLLAAAEDRIHAYFVLSLLVGVRTEDARALRWDHLDLDGDPPVPPHVGVWWQDTGLVFTTYKGALLDAANIRRSFRRICRAAGIGEHWTLRDLRHSFVSISAWRKGL